MNALVLKVDEKPGMQAMEWPSDNVETDSGAVVRALKSTYKRQVRSEDIGNRWEGRSEVGRAGKMKGMTFDSAIEACGVEGIQPQALKRSWFYVKSIITEPS